MIASSPDVGYIHEPFNPTHRPGICEAETDRYFLHVRDSDPNIWRAGLQNTLAFRYAYQAEWAAVRSLKDLLRMIQDAGTFAWHRLRQRRALMKDPIALFSAEWIAETFDAKVVLLMRHPAAFASSLKRLGWDFPFEHLLSQPHLMDTLLAPFKEKIDAYRRKRACIVDQGILLWRIFAHTITIYQERHPEWHFVRHEDVATNPISNFRPIFNHLDLEFTDCVEETLRHHTTASNSAEASNNAIHDLKRDSSALAHIWRQRLTTEEIDRVFERTNPYREALYPSTPAAPA